MGSKWWRGLAPFALVLAVAGCGDDEASTAAFCESTEEVQDAFESFDGDVEAVVDSMEALIDDAPEEIADDFELLLDAFRDAEEGDSEALESLADDEDFEDATDNIQEFVREECDIDLSDTGSSSSDEESEESESEDEESESEDEEPTGDLPDADSSSGLGDNATFDALAADCEDGDLGACDDLYLQTAVGSDYEAYGSTCGGRIAPVQGMCEEELGQGGGLEGSDEGDADDDGGDGDEVTDGLGDDILTEDEDASGSTPSGDDLVDDEGNPVEVDDPEPPASLGDDATFDVLAERCFDGVGTACDELFAQSDSGSEYEAYGDSCAGRIPEDTGLSCARLDSEGRF